MMERALLQKLIFATVPAMAIMGETAPKVH
jgi:hypothetical protein